MAYTPAIHACRALLVRGRVLVASAFRVTVAKRTGASLALGEIRGA